jgi:4'-phosphopantetheinyl transferase
MPLHFSQSENLLYLTRFSQHNAIDYWPILSSQEKKLVEKKVSSSLKNKAILSYGLRRKQLAALLNEDPQRLIFETTAHQKPILTHVPLHFNVSHSEDYWVILINASHPIGVDIEVTKKEIDFLALANRFFSKEETQIIIHAENSKDLFWQIWTAKEALLKATGQGLLNGLEHSVLFINQQKKWQAHAAEFQSWQLETLTITTDAVLSAAIPCNQSLFYYFF